MKKIFIFICLGIIMAAAGETMAESKPVQLSITPDAAIYDRNTTIEGLTLGIWSENPQKALAFGVVSGSSGNSSGFSIGWLVNYADSYKGVQWAPVNYNKGDFVGWQHGGFNYTKGSSRGLHTGLVNYAGNLTGLQLGFVNYATTATSGVQIGIINLIPKNEWFTGFPGELAPGMIIVNWRF